MSWWRDWWGVVCSLRVWIGRLGLAVTWARCLEVGAFFWGRWGMEGVCGDVAKDRFAVSWTLGREGRD